MKYKVREVCLFADNTVGLRCVEPDAVAIKTPSIMSIDGSTTNTGIAIARLQDGALYNSISCAREDKETPVQYKVRLKRFIKDIITANREITHIVYEEPFIGYAESIKNLFMLRTFIEEIIVEDEPRYDYINHFEMNNKKWKKLFLEPEKLPSNSELEKELVRKKILKYLPFMKDVSQDEIDAYAMGFVSANILKTGTVDELKSKKKASAFKYEIQFIGAIDDEYVMDEFYDVYRGPEKILKGGIHFYEVSGRERLDKKIYESMGQEDKLLLMKFSSKTHGNIILQHKIGHLASEFPYIYAIVWRKNRKY